MAQVVSAKYHSCWDGGIDIETNCKVDLKTREVFDIEQANVEGFDLEILEDEFIEIQGCQYVVCPKSELEKGSNSYWRED